MPIAKQTTTCYHCGETCTNEPLVHDQHDFCCQGCKTVYTLLNDTGLVSYYEIDGASPGSTVRADHANKDFLDLEEVKRQFIDFSEGSRNKVTFYLPSMHCAACIWLLEKLERLHQGVYRSEVNFVKKELTVHFNNELLSLKELVILLEDLGYTPDLQRDKGKKSNSKESRSLILKMGVAGFAFGNIMLFSFPEYLSIEDESLGSFKDLFGYLNLLLAIPVLVYADVDYLKSAWRSIRLRYLTIDVPIALGIITLFSRSAYEVLSGSGPGFFDSFAGLIFFLLIGKWYQSRTYEALAFDRDFKSYFPMAVTRLRSGGKEEVCMLEQIEKGDRIKLLNNQVVPADSIIIKGMAAIDYSFVNGESDVLEKREGDLLYAGGRQTGAAIEIEVVRDVSQSYLTGLWNQSAFSVPENEKRFSHLIDRVSRTFSVAILTIAVLTLAYWLWIDAQKAIDAFSAVLIIACPCALALSMPFTAGNVSRILGKLGFFVKNTATLEKMAAINTVVFDKTGTLTKTHGVKVTFQGPMLSTSEIEAIKSVVANSTHPLSVAITNQLEGKTIQPERYQEIAGKGVMASVGGHDVKIGAASLGSIPHEAALAMPVFNQSAVYAWIDNRYLGFFLVEKEIRNGMPTLLSNLQKQYGTYLLSGDHEGERSRMEKLFGANSTLKFKQSPLDKLRFLEKLKSEGRYTMMLGDGLNDAGALKIADVGVAVADDVFTFSPACDVILQADRLKHLHLFLIYVKQSINIVKMSVLISLIYNVVGIYFAVRGELTPLVAAILMPLSSVTVVGFVSLMTNVLRPKLDSISA